MGHNSGRPRRRPAASTRASISAPATAARTSCPSRPMATRAICLAHFVRELNSMTIEVAVKKITSETAAIWGIPDRGLLQQGYIADIVVFDPQTINRGEEKSMSRTCRAMAAAISATRWAWTRSSSAAASPGQLVAGYNAETRGAILPGQMQDTRRWCLHELAGRHPAPRCHQRHSLNIAEAGRGRSCCCSTAFRSPGIPGVTSSRRWRPPAITSSRPTCAAMARATGRPRCRPTTRSSRGQRHHRADPRARL